MLVSIVLPAYNEEKTIEKAIDSIYNFFSQKKGFSIEVIVVDDCSSDKTNIFVKSKMKNYVSLRCLRNKKNRGKGYSVKRGVLESSGDYIMFIDSDMSTPIEEFNKLWKFCSNFDFVFASRGLSDSIILEHQIWLKESVSKLGNRVIRYLLGLPFLDTQCGFKIFSKKVKDVFKLQTIDRWGFDMEILYIAKKMNFSLKEVPVVWKNDSSSLVKPIDYFIVFFNIFDILLNNIKGKYIKKN